MDGDEDAVCITGMAHAAKLVAYVKGGGTLMLAASHLTVQDAPDGAFVPYNGGDWSELVGVKLRDGKPWHLPHGMKFVKNPGPNWNFQPLTNVWDPDFIEGGFDVPLLEATAAKPFAAVIPPSMIFIFGLSLLKDVSVGTVISDTLSHFVTGTEAAV